MGIWSRDGFLCLLEGLLEEDMMASLMSLQLSVAKERNKASP